MDQLSSLFGGGNQKQIPPFTSEGGVTPEQTALADFTAGQGHVNVGNEFASVPHSTMATQAHGGVEFGKAKQLGGMSDINQTAMYDLYQNDVNSELNDLAAQNANEGAQQNALGKLIVSGFGTPTGTG